MDWRAKKQQKLPPSIYSILFAACSNPSSEVGSMGCEFCWKIMVHLRACWLYQEPLHDLINESTCGDTTGSFWAVCPGRFWLHMFSNLDETRMMFLTRAIQQWRWTGGLGKCFGDVLFFSNHRKCMYVRPCSHVQQLIMFDIFETPVTDIEMPVTDILLGLFC